VSSEEFAPRRLVLFSGGLESTVLSWWAREAYGEVELVSLDYGQRFASELNAARQIARMGRFRYHRVNCRVGRGAAIRAAAEQPRDNLDLPGRSFLAIAAAIALAGDSPSEILIGSVASDRYPDTRPEWLHQVSVALSAGRPERQRVNVSAPFAEHSKEELIRLGRLLGAPIEHSYSCQARGRRQCRACEPCRTRVRAFDAVDSLPAERPTSAGFESAIRREHERVAAESSWRASGVAPADLHSTLAASMNLRPAFLQQLADRLDRPSA
jgi:7-cyano-7-deazaguanine synthase